MAGRPSWDCTAVLYAVRGARDYWTMSEPGFCLMHAKVPHGYNEWLAAPGKNHRYLIRKMPTADLAKVIEGLMLQPPARQ